MANDLDNSYTGDFGGGASMTRQPVGPEAPSNLPGPANLGGEVGQLEAGFKVDFGNQSALDSFMDETRAFTQTISQNPLPPVEGLGEVFDSYMDNSLGGKI